MSSSSAVELFAPDLLPYLSVSNAEHFVRLSQTLRKTLLTPGGKLCMARLDIDLDETDGMRLLECIDLASLRHISLVGSCEHLPHVLDHIAGMTCSESWHVQEVIITEEDSGHEIKEEVEQLLLQVADWVAKLSGQTRGAEDEDDEDDELQELDKEIAQVLSRASSTADAMQRDRERMGGD
eukprot:gnl/TRDRNA2_/TRDRNA2_61118_c0_seq1.p1 gnl/TRDRNA2_/TRDRNA2_61118_c0~~gnl/TRDRNA2_/TRDRNA2_61118_c0_seq1.p1  ORF type:complete len:181 (+),score=34.96 gnl/TRDRNA2_/TRDRNA2_61118_c0_seq1:46-588(+)